MNIVANQRSAYVSQAMSAGLSLAKALRSITPAERAAVIATITAAANVPLDLVLLAEADEATEARRIVDGVLARCISDPCGYRLGGDHLFSIVSLRKEPNYE